MAEGSSNNGIIKVGNNNIVRYSNDLIRRAIDEIALKSQQIISQASPKKEIFVIGFSGEYGTVTEYLLQHEGFNAHLCDAFEFELPFTEIFAQLSEKQYDMVIVTYWKYYRILPELQKRFPKVKVIFLNSYSSEFDAYAKQHGVDDILRVPFEWDELINRIKNMFLA